MLFDSTGEKVDEKMDGRMEFHFNAMLDINSQMRKDRSFTSDASLLSMYHKNPSSPLEVLHFTKKRSIFARGNDIPFRPFRFFDLHSGI